MRTRDRRTVRPSLPRRRRWSFAATGVALGLGLIECASYGAGTFLQAKWCMYAPPRPGDDARVHDYGEYLRRRDGVLGWPYAEEFGGARFDASGARPSPAFPDPDAVPSAVALYGDSFTQSANSDEDAWGNVLARLAGRRVANYGVGGYGTDQAYLRFRTQDSDASPFVVLSHLSENILRNLTRNRDLLNYTMYFAYKPRFVLLGDGALELVPLPALTEDEHLRLLGRRTPVLELAHESFRPGGPAGATLLSFPFTWSLLRNLGDFRMRAKLAGRSDWAEFYERGHALRGLETTREICRAFVDEARRRQRTPLCVLLPARQDLERFRATQEWTYRNLADELAATGVEAADFGPELALRAEGRNLDEVFDSTGHFTPMADRLLAEFVLARLARLPGWPPPAGR
jgi:hypothetical protein